MSQLFMDGFDHYGSDINNLLDGAWAQISQIGAVITLDVPVAGARTGALALRVNSLSANVDSIRRVLPATTNELFIGFGLFVPGLPTVDKRIFPMQIGTAANVEIASVIVRPDGGMDLRSGDHNGTILGATPGPVIVANTWHHIECRFVRSDTVGVFELRVDEIVVMSLSALNLGLTDIGQIKVAATNFTNGYYIDDLIVRDATGTTNNTFMGDLKVATLQPIANGINQGWTKRTISKLGVGVMNFLDPTNRDQAITYADDAAFELGAGDFTVEQFVRFNTLLATTETATISSKHRPVTDERSWRLLLNGPDVGANLVFATSTDGTAGDEINVHAFPFIPEVNRWYHIAVSRSGGSNRMFLDGQQIGTTKADARVYNDNTAKLFVNGHQNGVSTAFDDESMNGWMDGFRLTVGVARYTGNFVPPTATLPTDVAGDSLFNSVQLLLNFDTTSNVDESANGFAGTLLNAPTVELPDDAIAFQTIDGLAPNDNNFVEAALVAATGTLTLTANPLDTETVVMDAVTYKFVTALAAANDVLIGATADDSLDNLVAAVNAAAGEGVTYGTGTVQNATIIASDLPNAQILATARTPGSAGNALATTTTVTGGSWAGATLADGADIPANSEYTVSQLPADVTGVRSVAIVGRNFKSDSGSAQMQMSFVTSGGSSDQGADRPVTLNPTYYEDTFERDPATLGALTPSTLLNARIRLDRTL